jgi:integrase
MAVEKLAEGKYKVRWREGGRHRSLIVTGPRELANKILRKKMSIRDENRHLDVKREVNFSMTTLIDRYWDLFSSRKKSAEREKGILKGIRRELGNLFVREVDGPAADRWYRGLTAIHGLTESTALRHYNVMHHMMGKAAQIWSHETGIDRNPADLIDVVRPDDRRDRFLSAEEMHRLKQALDTKMIRKGLKDANVTYNRLRMIVLLALMTGMRQGEILLLEWDDIHYREEIIAVRAKLKGGSVRYVPLVPELAAELRRYPRTIGQDRIFPLKKDVKGERQRVEKSFAQVLEIAGIREFRFHDTRHTFASWYMMNGGDLYELAKILGHSNIKMTERYAKLARRYIAKTGDTARRMWTLMEGAEQAQMRTSA